MGHSAFSSGLRDARRSQKLHSICECKILHLDRFELNDLKKLP